MLTNLPKILFSTSGTKKRYYLQIRYADSEVHVNYVPFFHEDNVVFSYWVDYGSEHIIVEKVEEFLKKWVDKGNLVVRN